MFTLIPLFGKKIEDLTLEDLSKVKSVLKLDIELTEDLRKAGIALLKGSGINTAAELIQSPDSIQQLLSFFQQQKQHVDVNDNVVIRCPHCQNFFF